eukprot:6187369-Pleurochrysis_carterae.AAC.4
MCRLVHREACVRIASLRTFDSQAHPSDGARELSGWLPRDCNVALRTTLDVALESSFCAARGVRAAGLSLTRDGRRRGETRQGCVARVMSSRGDRACSSLSPRRLTTKEQWPLGLQRYAPFTGKGLRAAEQTVKAMVVKRSASENLILARVSQYKRVCKGNPWSSLTAGYNTLAPTEKLVSTTSPFAERSRYAAYISVHEFVYCCLRFCAECRVPDRPFARLTQGQDTILTAFCRAGGFASREIDASSAVATGVVLASSSSTFQLTMDAVVSVL